MEEMKNNPPDGPAWEAARNAGFDMDLIDDCLARSPAERLRIHALALLTAERLKKAMDEQIDATARST